MFRASVFLNGLEHFKAFREGKESQNATRVRITVYNGTVRETTEVRTSMAANRGADGDSSEI